MKQYTIRITGEGSIEQIAGALEDMAISLRRDCSEYSEYTEVLEDSILCAEVKEKE